MGETAGHMDTDQRIGPAGRRDRRWLFAGAIAIIMLGLVAWLLVLKNATRRPPMDARRQEMTALGWRHAAEATKLLLSLDHKGADERFADALIVASQLPAVRVMRAVGYMSRGRFGSAVAELRIVYGTESPPPIAVRLLALCYYRLGKKSFARETFEHSRVLQPDSEAARFYEALSQADAARSLELLETLVNECPELIEARLRRARLRVSQGEPAGGIADALEAIRQEPNEATSWSELAEYLLAIDRPWAAGPCLERVVELDAGRADALEKLAELAADAGDFSRAGELIDRAMELDTSRRGELRARRDALAQQAGTSQPGGAGAAAPAAEDWRTLLEQVADSPGRRRMCAKLLVGKVLAELHETGLADGLPAGPSAEELAEMRSVIRESEARTRETVERVLELR